MRPGPRAARSGSGSAPDRLAPREVADGADRPGARLERRWLAMGSEFRLSLEAPDRPAAVAASEAALEALGACERRLSTWDADSEVSRALAAPLGDRVELSAACAAELAAAWGWSAATDGAFDPRAGALVDAYGLRGPGRWPSSRELEAARRGSSGLCFDGKRLWREDSAARLAEGGFAKGAGLDAALAALRARGIREATLCLGGQVAVLGSARLLVSDPADPGRPLLALRLADGSLASSDNRRSARLVDGRLLPHLFDPRSGLPADWPGSVSVFAPSALAADALSTGLFVLGAPGFGILRERHPELGLLLLAPTSAGWRASLCPRLRAALLWSSPEVELAAWPPAVPR